MPNVKLCWMLSYSMKLFALWKSFCANRAFPASGYDRTVFGCSPNAVQHI